jgi:glutamyl-tRNA reductase
MTSVVSEETTSPLAGLHVIGLDHRTCPDPIREAVFVADAELPEFLETLRQVGFSEAMVMSTCDRVEIRAIHDGTDDVAAKVAEALTTPTPIEARQIVSALYHHTGVAALTHIFRVSAALESQVIGEPQVLGQVRASHRLATSLGMAGASLEPVLRASYTAAKRVRSETAIAEGPTSLVAAAIRVARSIHGALSGCHLAMLGVDDIALMMGAQFQENGLEYITISDRVPRRAERAARDLSAHIADFETRSKTLAQADILLCANGDGRYAVDAEMLQSALRARRRKPIFIIDLAVPADVDPAVERLDDAFLYDLNDLENLAVEGKSGRQAAITEAERIINEEISSYLGGLAGRDADSLIVELREAVERERLNLLREKPFANVEEATRLLASRLLHRPSEALRALASEDKLDTTTETLIRALLVPDDQNKGETGEF